MEGKRKGMVEGLIFVGESSPAVRGGWLACENAHSLRASFSCRTCTTPKPNQDGIAPMTSLTHLLTHRLRTLHSLKAKRHVESGKVLRAHELLAAARSAVEQKEAALAAAREQLAAARLQVAASEAARDDTERELKVRSWGGFS